MLYTVTGDVSPGIVTIVTITTPAKASYYRHLGNHVISGMLLGALECCVCESREAGKPGQPAQTRL